MAIPRHHIEPLFENRYDAGHRLAAELARYRGRNAVVLAVPNGGLPIALGVALALEAELNLVISRKIPLPLNPEAGFGAVTDDGTMMLNDELVAKAGLTEQQITYQVNRVRAEIRQRSLLYHRERPPALVAGRTVILIDDGLATGYTMMAAATSLRGRRPGELVVAIPVAPEVTARKVAAMADGLITCQTATHEPFYVSEYYRYWHEVSDDEAVQCLKEWQMRRFRDIIEPTNTRPE